MQKKKRYSNVKFISRTSSKLTSQKKKPKRLSNTKLKKKQSKFENRLYNLGKWILAHPKKIAVVYLLAMGLLVWGTTKVNVPHMITEEQIASRIPNYKILFENTEG